MQLLKSPSIISAAVAALALGGCATSPQQVQDPSPEYRAGCDSAFADAGSDERQYNQDSGRFENEPGYRANWAMGYSDCMNRLRDNGQFGGAPVLNTLPARTF
ncbi:hypothetical protein [Spectribacter hydrogenoxidans]|uniref:Lipoprotein n=1 Tax=Spectribacter hydrogenoxidans TaxID=3075608 RepID=A0ABU3C2Z0_9GAMM|nr:hypothetical protein [Salinisphaera sp. W335]MDT0635927.1 hypothetical protein [Salinisphaera sp. W335]